MNGYKNYYYYYCDHQYYLSATTFINKPTILEGIFRHYQRIARLVGQSHFFVQEYSIDTGQDTKEG